jgi:hypothetical protein
MLDHGELHAGQVVLDETKRSLDPVLAASHRSKSSVTSAMCGLRQCWRTGVDRERVALVPAGQDVDLVTEQEVVPSWKWTVIRSPHEHRGHGCPTGRSGCSPIASLCRAPGPEGWATTRCVINRPRTGPSTTASSWVRIAASAPCR